MFVRWWRGSAAVKPLLEEYEVQTLQRRSPRAKTSHKKQTNRCSTVLGLVDEYPLFSSRPTVGPFQDNVSGAYFFYLTLFQNMQHQLIDTSPKRSKYAVR